MKLSSFRYKDKKTVMHNLDPRIKIFIIGTLSLILILSDFLQATILGSVVVFLGLIGRVNIFKCFLETKVFLLLLAFILLIHSFSTRGDLILPFLGLEIPIEGFIYGNKIVLRLILIVSLGFIYSSTTAPEKTRAVFEWFLSPLPVNEKAIGTSASIGIRFFPILTEEMQRIQDAHKTRFAERAGILKRLKIITSLLIIRTLERAKRISMAMDAKCYSTKHPSRHKLTILRRDYLILVVFIVLTAIYLSAVY